MSIPAAFENQSVFITGGTGFIGKVLIEKLLYSCPGVKKIYVLIRSRKNKSAQERLDIMLNMIMFDRIRKECPGQLKKVIAIEGDCMELGLGISADNLQKLKEVTLIYHVAANVRFDDSLRDAILMNTRSTYEIIKIAETLDNLKHFMHVSTTYCYPDRTVVEEKVYPAYGDWRASIKLAETYDTELLQTLYPKYSNDQPNTYTFTKSLAEQIILEYKDKLPVMIFRPSIVTSAIVEPISGWVDNFNGPMGLLVACGIGIMRTNYGNPDIVSDFLPVDVCVRGMLVASYSFLSNKIEPGDLFVTNAATSNLRPVTQGEIIATGTKIVRESPFEKTLWVPGGNITRCYFYHLIRFIFLHLLVAILLDGVYLLTGRKPFFLKLQRRIYAATCALQLFLNKSWDFKNEGFVDISRHISKEDLDAFGYMHYAEMDFETIVRRGATGARRFLLNEPEEVSRAARIRMKVYKAIHYSVGTLFILIAVRFLYRYICAYFQ